MIQERFNTWLETIIKTENPDSSIIAYYFGIIEKTDGYAVYLIGSTEFDENDSDWACNDDFIPKEKYFILGQKDTDWKLILNHVKVLIETFSQTETFESSFFHKANAIATGFDDGDLHRIK